MMELFLCLLVTAIMFGAMALLGYVAAKGVTG
jgi:FtsH-binding integral membrane protein